MSYVNKLSWLNDGGLMVNGFHGQPINDTLIGFFKQ